MLIAESSPDQDFASPRATLKALRLLGPSVFAAPILQDFQENTKNFGIIENRKT